MTIPLGKYVTGVTDVTDVTDVHHGTASEFDNRISRNMMISMQR